MEIIDSYNKLLVLFKNKRKHAIWIIVIMIAFVIGIPIWNYYNSYMGEKGKAAATNTHQEVNNPIKISPFDDKTFGILVASFSGSTESEKENGKRIQHSVATTINARINKENIADTLAAELPLNESSGIDSTEKARTLGEKYNAQIVIWGDNSMNRIIPRITTIIKDHQACQPLSNGTAIQPLNNIITRSDIIILDQSLTYKSIEDAFQDIGLPIFTDDPLSIALCVIGRKYEIQGDHLTAASYFLKAINEKTIAINQ